VGARELDAFLTDKDAVAGDIEGLVRRRAGELGLEVVSVGIRDVILPGDMKDLMNKVTSTGKLNVVLGEKGLAERVVNLL